MIKSQANLEKNVFKTQQNKIKITRFDTISTWINIYSELNMPT